MIKVKKLSSIEEMGSVNSIVTENVDFFSPGKFNVVRFWQGYAREFD